MNYTLRPYQQQAVDKGLEFFRGKSKKNVVEVLPTGSGKSLIIANIAKELNGKLIIFQPSKELLEQNFEKYISYGEFAEIYSASMGRKKISSVTFATIGSVVNKPELFSEFEYCIVDECHLVSPDNSTMYKKFFDNLKLKVLGLTATPIRMKRYNFPVPHAKICMLDRMRPKFFNEYIHITQISEMKENNYFADIDYFSFDFNASKLQINSTGGDYTEKSINISLRENSVLEKISGLYKDICAKGIIKHLLIFVESVYSAFELQKMLGDNNCGVVTGTTPKTERKEILKLFKDGRLKSVVNVGVLTTGFDFPELDCIIGARPTMSLGLYYQIIGRCVRPHPEKTKSYVFDFVGNFKRFGKVEDLVIDKIDNLWCIRNKERVLTNNDISGQDLDVYDKYDKKTEPSGLMTFGKYKGQELNTIPNSYWQWFTKEVQQSKYNKFIFDYIEKNVLINKNKMARPERNNVDYFPFICEEGKKMFYIEETYGNDGFATFVKLLRELAKSDYHYLDLSKNTTFMFISARCKVSKETLEAIIKDLVELGKFDKILWEENKIIWCQDFINSIQDAYSKRNNKCITYEGLLTLLISLGVRKQVKVQSIVPDNTQSKEEYSKVDNTKEKKSKEYKTILLSEIKISDFPELNEQFVEIAQSFHKLIKHNLEEKGISSARIDKTKGKEIDQIRLLIESDKFTLEDCRTVFTFLKKNEFWKTNIQSIPKLREKFTQLISQAKSKSGKDKDEEMNQYKQRLSNDLQNG